MNEADKILEDLFKEEEESLGTPLDESEPPKQPESTTSPVDNTKAFSERLKKEKEKLKTELAKELGYESWEKATEDKANNVLLDKGIDPDTVKPILKELLKSDPDYIAAIEYKKEKEEIEKNLWAENEIKKLNDRFGLGLKSVEDLDEQTVKLWNSGLPLEKAYVAEHYAELENKANRRSISPNGKEHLTPTPGKAPSDGDFRKPTKEEIRMFKILNPSVTDDDIMKYINK